MTLLRDLGFVDDTAASSTCRVALKARPPCLRGVARKIADVVARIERCEATAAQASEMVRHPPGRVLVQNIKSSVVDALLLGHAGRTTCGWHLSVSKAHEASSLFLPSLAGIPWFSICEKCLDLERDAGRKLAAASGLSDDSEYARPTAYSLALLPFLICEWQEGN